MEGSRERSLTVARPTAGLTVGRNKRGVSGKIAIDYKAAMYLSPVILGRKQYAAPLVVTNRENLGIAIVEELPGITKAASPTALFPAMRSWVSTRKLRPKSATIDPIRHQKLKLIFQAYTNKEAEKSALDVVGFAARIILGAVGHAAANDRMSVAVGSGHRFTARIGAADMGVERTHQSLWVLRKIKVVEFTRRKRRLRRWRIRTQYEWNSITPTAAEFSRD